MKISLLFDELHFLLITVFLSFKALLFSRDNGARKIHASHLVRRTEFSLLRNAPSAPVSPFSPAIIAFFPLNLTANGTLKPHATQWSTAFEYIRHTCGHLHSRFVCELEPLEDFGQRVIPAFSAHGSIGVHEGISVLGASLVDQVVRSLVFFSAMKREKVRGGLLQICLTCGHSWSMRIRRSRRSCCSKRPRRTKPALKRK